MRWLKELYRSLWNLVKFFKVVWRWRWYDYSYSLDLLIKDLELREREWGVSTHYVGDSFTKKRIQVVLRYYYSYVGADDYIVEDKMLKKFLTSYTRLIRSLWD